MKTELSIKVFNDKNEEMRSLTSSTPYVVSKEFLDKMNKLFSEEAHRCADEFF